MFKKEKKESAAKRIKCNSCGQEISEKTKFCTSCGAKNKKSILQKKWFWVLIIFLLLGSMGSGGDHEHTSDDPSQSPQKEQVSETEQTQEKSKMPEPDGIELETDFEKAFWEVVYHHNAALYSIETVISEGSEDAAITAGVGIENDENTVNTFLKDVANVISANDTTENAIIIFADIDDGPDGDVLLMAGVYDDGTFETSMESPNYNTARNQWINSQFSAWNGAHRELEKLIIKNMNDEDSYKHIETTYRDISSQSIADEVNKILADAGYSQRVAVGDLFISTTFSGKNAFGGTIKNTAFGIAGYSTNTITLVDMG